MRLKDLFAQFIDWAGDALAPATVNAYEHQLRKFLKRTSNLNITQIRPMHLSRYCKTWHEGQAVLRAFNWAAADAGILKKNPLQSIRLPCRGRRQRTLSPREITELVRSSRAPGRAFLVALRETFARPQEIRAAMWEQLHSEDPRLPIEEALPHGKALIVQQRFKDRAKRGDTTRPRVLLVSKRLGRLIARLHARRTQGQRHIFTNSRGRAWTKDAVRCLLRRLRKKLLLEPNSDGENIVAYTFRHSGATTAAASGMSDAVLADILGHVDTRTTRRYQHLRIAHLRVALDKMQQDLRPQQSEMRRSRLQCQNATPL